jgi:hypothetical protein
VIAPTAFGGFEDKAKMSAGITRAAPTSNRTHNPTTISDSDNATSPKTMNQTNASALYVYDIGQYSDAHFTHTRELEMSQKELRLFHRRETATMNWRWRNARATLPNYPMRGAQIELRDPSHDDRGHRSGGPVNARGCSRIRAFGSSARFAHEEGL